MWATPGFRKGNIYFDKSQWTSNNSYIYFVAGKQKMNDDYSSVYPLSTTIEHTQLVKGWCSNGEDWWGGLTHMAIIGNGSSVTAGSDWNPANLSGHSLAHYSAGNNSVDVDNSSNPFLCTVASSSNGAALTISEKTSGITGLNYTLTLKYAVSKDGGAPAELTSGYVPATLTCSTYKFVSGTYDAVSSSSLANTLTKNGSRYSSAASAAHTASTTLEVSSIDANYVFLGWYTAADGGTQLSSATTYSTYVPTADATIYARFAPKFEVGSTLYFRPGDTWMGSSPRFAAVFGNATTQQWENCTAVSGSTNFYSVNVPSGSWGYVIFCRMNPNNATNNWDNIWTQTKNMYKKEYSDKAFVPHNTGTSDNSKGEWILSGYEASENGIKYVTTEDPVEWKFNGQSAQTRDLNTVTNLYLKEWFTYEYENCDVWTAKNDGSHADYTGINSSVMKYNIHRTAVSAGAYTSIAKNWVSNADWSEGYKKSKAGHNNQNVNLLSGLGSGKYTMSYCYYDPDLHITSPTHSLKWTIGVPSISSPTCTSDGSGSGTSLSPFTVAVGEDLTLTVGGSQASSDANSVLYAKFGSNEYSSTLSYTIEDLTASLCSLTVKAKYYNSADDLSGAEQTWTIYYQGTLTPSIALSSFTQNESTITSAISGETVTINASRQNAGEAEITYAYSTDNSNWTTIATTTSTTQDWELPAITSTTTYYVKVSMTYNETNYSDTKTIKVYGKKTIKVKNTNNWSPFSIYLGSGDVTNSYPGNTTNISTLGTSEQWKQVVLYSSSTNFRFTHGTSTSTADANRTAETTYASISDGGCYEVASGSGNNLALNSTANCPAKPSVSVSAASSITNTTATINGSVSSYGNDALTEYGFYWSNSYSTAAALQSNGTKVQKGTTGTFTGSLTHNLTSLTAGNTIYYITYATNGQGTTLSSVQSFVVPYSVQVQKPTGCSSITPSAGDYYYSTGFTVTTVAATGYTFSSWSATNGSTSSAASPSAGTNTVTFTPSANSAVIKPVYTENSYSVTVSNDGHGAVSPTGTVSVKQVTGTTLTATPSSNYVFKDWTISGGGITPSSSTSATQVFKATTTGGTIRANFADEWNIMGNQWGSWSTYNGMPATENEDEFSVTLTLAARTNYQFKVVKRVYNSENVYYTKASTTFTRGGTTSVTGLTTGGTGNHMTLTTDAAGEYTFTFKYNADVSKMKVTITFPEAYTITFGKGTGGATITATGSASGTLTSGNYVASGEDVTFTESALTGYTFSGWYDAATSGSAVSGMSKSDYVLENVTADKNVYSRYTADQYNITCNYATNSGTKDSGDDVNQATYDQNTIPVPTVHRDGYCFNGWYSAASGGVLVIDAAGNLQRNVEVSSTTWTDGTGKWKKTGSATVYAQFSIPEITLTKTPEQSLLSSMPGHDTVVVHREFSCEPTGTYNLQYTIGYAVNHTQLEVQPTIKYGTDAGVGHDTIIMPVADGPNQYEAVAHLRTGSVLGSGSLVKETDTIRVDVESSYLVKIRYRVDGTDIQEEKSWYLYPSYRAYGVNIPKELKGYEFDSCQYGVGITVASENEDLSGYVTKNCYASNPSTITAVYKPKSNTVYFFNTFTKYFYSTIAKKYDYGTTGYWNDEDHNGTGAKGKTNDTIISTGGYDEPRWMASIGATTTKLAFTNREMDGSERFWGSDANNQHPRVIYRTDFDKALPMFVPVTTNVDADYYILNQHEYGEADYYRGFWVKYHPNTDSTGYYLNIYDGTSKGADLIQRLPLALTQTGEGDSWELSATADLEGNKTYGFVYTQALTDTTYTFGKSSTITSGSNTGIVFNTIDIKNDAKCGLTTTTAGDYTFHVYCKNFGSKNANTASQTDVQGQLAVTVDYSTVSGDYRVLYTDTASAFPDPIASASIRKRAEGKDTVSFFIRPNKQPILKIQTYSGSSWGDVAGGGIDLSGLTKDSVYVIYLEQNAEGTSIAKVGSIDFYDGDYYIRTDCVDEHKWDYKQSLDAHRMISSDFGMTSQQPFKFSHYYVHWVASGGNVKFVVANKYAPCLTDTVITDSYATGAGGVLGAYGANIRFMYNKSTNAVQRAYLHGSNEGDDDYLKLTEKPDDNKLQNSSGSDIDAIKFTDNGNWTYTAQIKAKPGLKATLTAKYNGLTQYFKGNSSNGDEILGGTGDAWHDIDMTYDFKTNRLICAWRPSGTEIDEDLSINADVLIIRKAQGDAEQIVFKDGDEDAQLSKVKYIYGVIQFDYDDMYHMMYSWNYYSYEHCMYYISFPFDVLVNDITGVGTLGQDWRLQRYNGAKRAQGWFSGDGVTTFWEDLHAGDTLKAYEGYSLLLNRNRFNGTTGNIWDYKTSGSSVYLYFPSANATTGSLANDDVTIHVPEHECTLDRPFQQDPSKNHKVVDSHWNMIGTPLFEDKTASKITPADPISGETLKYIYAWNSMSNSLGIRWTLDGTWEFKTMYGYMAQFAGDITFSGSTVNNVVAAKRLEHQKNYTLNLEISKDDQFVGRTYVELNENAVDTFALNEDVCMLKNGVTADLYTFSGAYEAGANVLTVGNHVVRVGIDVKTAGTYTFSMPDNFDGTVTLIDTYTQTRTNLAMDDYMVNLPTGENVDRFLLEININQSPTAIDGVTDGSGSLKDGKAHKFIMNDQMYILINGELFDATGRRVK